MHNMLRLVKSDQGQFNLNNNSSSNSRSSSSSCCQQKENVVLVSFKELNADKKSKQRRANGGVSIQGDDAIIFTFCCVMLHINTHTQKHTHTQYYASRMSFKLL